MSQLFDADNGHVPAHASAFTSAVTTAAPVVAHTTTVTNEFTTNALVTPTAARSPLGTRHTLVLFTTTDEDYMGLKKELN